MKTRILSFVTFLRPVEFLSLMIILLIPLQKIRKYKPSVAFKQLFYSQESIANSLCEKIRFFQIDVLIVILGLLSLFHYRKNIFRFFMEREKKFLSLFCLWSLCTIFFSPIRNVHLQYFQFFDLLLGCLLFCSLSSLELSHPERFFKTLLWGTFILTFIPCGIGIGHYFLQKPLGLHFLGEVKEMCSTFLVSDGSLWLFSPASHERFIQRAHGTFAHPNIFGGYLLIPIFCTLFHDSS